MLKELYEQKFEALHDYVFVFLSKEQLRQCPGLLEFVEGNVCKIDKFHSMKIVAGGMYSYLPMHKDANSSPTKWNYIYVLGISLNGKHSRRIYYKSKGQFYYVDVESWKVYCCHRDFQYGDWFHGVGPACLGI